MSIRALNWAFAQDLPKSNQKFVLVALADSADDYGICWPSYNTIAEKCSIDRGTAIRAINFLIEKGLVTKKSRFKSDGQNSNAFQLQMGVKISDDHPLKDLVADCHPLVADCHPPSGRLPPKSTIEPLKEKKALSRDEFLREIDLAYQENAFAEFSHLTESEIKHSADACLDFYGSKGEWPVGEPMYVLRHWIRGGIKNGTIRKTDKSQRALQESKPEIRADDLPEWKRKLLERLGEKVYISWIAALELTEKGNIAAPTSYSRDYVRNNYGDAILSVLPDAEIIYRELVHA